MSSSVPSEPVATARDGRVSSPEPTLLVLLAITVTVLAWASAFVVIRGAAADFHPGALALGRLAVGSVLLGGYLMVGTGGSRRRWVRPTAREWALILGFGIAWFGAYNVALNLAEETLDAGTTAMLVNVGPILIAVGAGLFLGEGIPRWLAIGAGVAFAGVLLIGLGTTGGAIGGGVGVLWCLVAAVTYAAGVLMQKPALRRLPAAQVTWVGCTIGAVTCLPFAGELVTDVRQASATSVLLVVYLGAVPTALAFSTWAYALSRVPAGRLGVTTYVVPPLTILAGWLVFEEVPAVLAIIGGAVCLLGVALSRRHGS